MMTKRDNYALGAAGLAVAGTPALGALKITNIVHYAADGRMYVKAATDNIAQALATFSPLASLAAAAIGASKILCLWVYIKASDGSVVLDPAVKAGLLDQPPSLTGAGYKVGVFEAPPERAGYAILGAIKIATNASGAYTPGTTSLGAANQTVTYYDLGPDLGVAIPY